MRRAELLGFQETSRVVSVPNQSGVVPVGLAAMRAKWGVRGFVAALVIALLIADAPPALGAERQVFKTKLTAAAEVQDPPVASSGRATAKLRTDGFNVIFGLLWANLTSDATAAHIHCGAAGTNGPVGVTLFSGSMGTSNTIKGNFDAPDPENACGWATVGDVLAAIEAGNAYVNLHTVNYPAGELRGQLAPA